MFKFDMTFDWKKWLKFGWISRAFFFFLFLNLLFVWHPPANGGLKHICLLRQVSRWMKTDTEFKTEWQTKNEWAHDRVKERWERRQGGRREGETLLPIFFPLLPKNQQLLSGSDSAKLISRRECESGEREKTCGDFRKLQPKVAPNDVMLHFVKLLTYAVLLCGETGLLISQTLSWFISYLDQQTQLYSKYCSVMPSYDLMGTLCTCLQSAAPGPLYKMFSLVIRAKSQTSLPMWDAVFQYCGQNSYLFQVEPPHTCI